MTTFYKGFIKNKSGEGYDQVTGNYDFYDSKTLIDVNKSVQEANEAVQEAKEDIEGLDNFLYVGKEEPKDLENCYAWLNPEEDGELTGALKEAIDDAQNAASIATTKAIEAATSEGNAKTYAANASTSATNAKTSETNAKTSENNAKTSESNALTSETNAKTSETNAAASEAKAQEILDSIPDDYSTLASTVATHSTDIEDLQATCLYVDDEGYLCLKEE